MPSNVRNRMVANASGWLGGLPQNKGVTVTSRNGQILQYLDDNDNWVYFADVNVESVQGGGAFNGPPTPDQFWGPSKGELDGLQQRIRPDYLDAGRFRVVENREVLTLADLAAGAHGITNVSVVHVDGGVTTAIDLNALAEHFGTTVTLTQLQALDTVHTNDVSADGVVATYRDNQGNTSVFDLNDWGTDDAPGNKAGRVRISFALVEGIPAQENVKLNDILAGKVSGLRFSRDFADKVLISYDEAGSLGRRETVDLDDFLQGQHLFRTNEAAVVLPEGDAAYMLGSIFLPEGILYQEWGDHDTDDATENQWFTVAPVNGQIEIDAAKFINNHARFVNAEDEALNKQAERVTPEQPPLDITSEVVVDASLQTRQLVDHIVRLAVEDEETYFADVLTSRDDAGRLAKYEAFFSFVMTHPQPLRW